MSISPKVTIIKRANFAFEPVVRGLGINKLDIKLDDMHVFGACVDNMDPITSYIELPNIDEVSVCTPDNHCGCGGMSSVNMKANSLDFNQGTNVILFILFISVKFL